jgi:hypothetical protein
LTSPAPTPPVPNGPLAHWLLHPGQVTAQVLHHLAHLALATLLVVGPPAAGLAILTAGFLLWLRARNRATKTAGARLVHVEVPPEVDPAGAETFWTNLVALLRPRWQRITGNTHHVAFELRADQAQIDIAVWVPQGVPPGFVEAAVEAAWPGARTRTEPATPPLPLDAAAATGGELRLAGPDHYPIRADHRADPLRPLLGALAGLGPGETACVQILARPVTGRRLNRPYRAAAARRAGRPSSRLARTLDLFTPGPAHTSPAVDPTRDRDVAAILDKAAQPSWAITIRYAAATTATATDAQAPDRQAKARLRGRAHGLASAFALYSGRNRFDRHRLARPARVLDARRLGRGDLVSIAELAALAHLPADTAIAGIVRAGAKPVPPPPGIPETGKILGDAETGGRRPVALAIPDARMHLHVMGSTGSGKSTLLTRLALGDIAAGRGVVVIDPKGDLITDIIARYPNGAPAPVIIDPDDRTAPPVLNVLDVGDAAERDLVVDNVVGIFRRIFEAYWGPRTDDILRAACLTLVGHANTGGATATLADVPRLLQDGGFRRRATAGIAFDRAGLGGFWAWYEELSEAGRSQVVGPVMNKLRAFLLRDFVRATMGPVASSFSMARVLDGGVLLARVSKGALGEEASRLLGSFVLAAVWQAATHRARLGEQARVDAAVYIDECQNFLTLPRSLEEMLAEARGYHLSLVLAHQHLAQLPRQLREAVSANARSKVYFAANAEDARALAATVEPEVSEHDLANLGRHQAACRLVVNAGNTAAFTIRTRPPDPPNERRAQAVRDAARRRYGRSPAERDGQLLRDGDGDTFPGAAPPDVHRGEPFPETGAGGGEIR